MNNKKWSAHQVFKKAVHCEKNTSTEYVPTKEKEVFEPLSLSDWEEILLKASILVERFGEPCLPLFYRAEKELQEARSRLDAIEKAKRIVRSSQTILMHQCDLIEP